MERTISALAPVEVTALVLLSIVSNFDFMSIQNYGISTLQLLRCIILIPAHSCQELHDDIFVEFVCLQSYHLKVRDSNSNFAGAEHP